MVHRESAPSIPHPVRFSPAAHQTHVCKVPSLLIQFPASRHDFIIVSYYRSTNVRPNPAQQATALRPSEGLRLDGFVGLSLNHRTIPFLVILLDKTVSVK